jgi:hypothetical protein
VYAATYPTLRSIDGDGIAEYADCQKFRLIESSRVSKLPVTSSDAGPSIFRLRDSRYLSEARTMRSELLATAIISSYERRVRPGHQQGNNDSTE